MKLAENQLRDYVLGALPEAEQTTVEQALLADRDQFDEACALENELVDRYVRNQMPAAERTRFEQHYLTSLLHRERVAIAKAFLEEIDRTPAEVTLPLAWWQRWRASFRMPQLALSGALAAALLLTAGIALWQWRERAQLNDQLAQARQHSQTEVERRATQQQQTVNELTQAQQRNQKLQTELEKLQQPKEPAPAPALLSFLLLSAATRDGNSSPTIIPRNQRNVQLLMPLDGARYAGYQTTLQTVEGRALFSLAARATQDRAFAALTLPATRLTRGDYVVILTGRQANGATEEIDRYFFRVQ